MWVVSGVAPRVWALLTREGLDMRRLLLPALLATLVLAGCSGDDDPEPKIAPSDSSSAASTTAPPPSPTGPVEPTLPPEAAGDDAAAAEAFARHFWATVNYAQVSGDTSTLAALGDVDCAACAGGIEEVERVHLAGGSMTGGTIDVRSVASQAISSGPSTGFAVTLEVDVSPQTVTVPGEKAKRYTGGPGTFQMIIERQDAGWIVERWDTK